MGTGHILYLSFLFNKNLSSRSSICWRIIGTRNMQFLKKLQVWMLYCWHYTAMLWRETFNCVRACVCNPTQLLLRPTQKEPSPRWPHRCCDWHRCLEHSWYCSWRSCSFFWQTISQPKKKKKQRENEESLLDPPMFLIFHLVPTMWSEWWKVGSVRFLPEFYHFSCNFVWGYLLLLLWRLKEPPQHVFLCEVCRLEIVDRGVN